MNTVTACFACTTPYQIMGAISIVCAEKLNADLIIFGMFEDYQAVADRIAGEGIFRHVFSVAPDKYRLPGKKGAAAQMFRAKSIVDSFLPSDICYQRYYSSSRAHIKNILLHELLRRNHHLEIVIYDDGMGTYAPDSHVLNTSKLRKGLEIALGWNLYTPARMSFSVYAPALFEKPGGLKDCPVRQMPKPTFGSPAGQAIRRVFNTSKARKIPEKVIIFDPLRGADRARDEKLRTIDLCYRHAADVFGEENVIIKPHPRSVQAVDVGLRVYQDTGVPMEALYADMADLDKRILITYASSAVYTPKMLFGVEPMVINLFRIVDGEQSEWSAQHEKFHSVYDHPDRLVAPATMEAYHAILDKLVQHN